MYIFLNLTKFKYIITNFKMNQCNHLVNNCKGSINFCNLCGCACFEDNKVLYITKKYLIN